jgi:hypothetical protein
MKPPVLLPNSHEDFGMPLLIVVPSSSGIWHQFQNQNTRSQITEKLYMSCHSYKKLQTFRSKDGASFSPVEKLCKNIRNCRWQRRKITPAETVRHRTCMENASREQKSKYHYLVLLMQYMLFVYDWRKLWIAVNFLLNFITIWFFY